MGPMEKAIAAVKTLLDDCPAFREIVGSDADPLQRIHWRSVNANPAGADEEFTHEQLARIRPCASLVHSAFSQGYSATGLWPSSGGIEVTVLQNVDEDDLIGDCLVDVDAELNWIRQCDKLLHDVRERAEQILKIHTISVVVEPGAAGRDEMQKYGPFYGFMFFIEYGDK